MIGIALPKQGSPMRHYRFGRILATLFATVWYFMLAACASWQIPEPADYSALAARGVSASVQEVRLTATVLGSADSHRLFGFDVNASGVQPVWVEVENPTPRTLWLLRAGTDPDYFSPLEVAWSFHVPLSPAYNAAIDEHFDALAFHSPIPPRSTRSGIIFTNPHNEIKVFNVDILGQRRLLPFTLFLPVGGDALDDKLSAILARHAAAAGDGLDDLDVLRTALEALPCCAGDATGSAAGDPINVVAVGGIADVSAALVRRGFRGNRMAFDDAQFLYGRPPDFVLRKTGQSSMPANWLRIWIAPLRFRGQPVFLIQSGRPVGGRFVVADGSDPVLHPDVDETRNLLIQDMMYSGGLSRLGFIGGVEEAERSRPRSNLAGNAYHTDGLRAVMFLTTRPLSLSDIELLDWVPLLDPQANDSTEESADARQ